MKFDRLQSPGGDPVLFNLITDYITSFSITM